MKYKLKATSIGINGIVYKKKDNIIFDPSDLKWAKVAKEIIAAYKDGHLEAIEETKKAKYKK